MLKGVEIEMVSRRQMNPVTWDERAHFALAVSAKGEVSFVGDMSTAFASPCYVDSPFCKVKLKSSPLLLQRVFVREDDRGRAGMP